MTIFNNRKKRYFSIKFYLILLFIVLSLVQIIESAMLLNNSWNNYKDIKHIALYDSDIYIKGSLEKAEIQLYIGIGIFIVSILLLMFVTVLINKKVIKPIKALVKILDELRDGFYENNVVCTEREDEIGYLARGVSLLQENLLESDRLKHILIDNERKLNDIASTIAEGLILLNKDGSISYINPAACSITGWSYKELKDNNVLDILFKDKNKNKCKYCKILYGDKAFINGQVHISEEETIWHKCGRPIPVSLVISPIIRNSTINGAVISFLDISSTKSKRAWLHMMKMAIEQSPLSTIITNTNGDIIYANAQTSKTTGYSLEELQTANMKIFKSNHTPKVVYDDMWNTVYKGSIWEGEMLNRKKDGTLFWEDISVSPVMDDKGNIVNFVTVRMDITEKRRIQQIFQQMSYTDGLTGLANRRSFDDKLLNVWERSADTKEPLAIMMIDIDFFKKYNDLFGHQQGDECLKSVSNVLNNAAQDKEYYAARYGGEEFSIILQNTNLQEAVCFANELVKAIEALKLAHPDNAASDYVTISAGAASCIANAYDSPKILVEQADKALYSAKNKGRNRVES